MIKPPFPEQVFESVDEWIASAYRRLRAHPDYNNTEHGELEGYRGEHFTAMCFDVEGRRCQRGADFHRARDENAFPVWWVWPDQIPELVRRAEMATAFDNLAKDQTPLGSEFEAVWDENIDALHKQEGGAT